MKAKSKQIIIRLLREIVFLLQINNSKKSHWNKIISGNGTHYPPLLRPIKRYYLPAHLPLLHPVLTAHIYLCNRLSKHSFCQSNNHFAGKIPTPPSLDASFLVSTKWAWNLAERFSAINFQRQNNFYSSSLSSGAPPPTHSLFAPFPRSFPAPADSPSLAAISSNADDDGGWREKTNNCSVYLIIILRSPRLRLLAGSRANAKNEPEEKCHYFCNHGPPHESFVFFPHIRKTSVFVRNDDSLEKPRKPMHNRRT